MTAVQLEFPRHLGSGVLAIPMCGIPPIPGFRGLSPQGGMPSTPGVMGAPPNIRVRGSPPWGKFFRPSGSGVSPLPGWGAPSTPGAVGAPPHTHPGSKSLASPCGRESSQTQVQQELPPTPRFRESRQYKEGCVLFPGCCGRSPQHRGLVGLASPSWGKSP